MNPHQSTKDFERALCEYTGAPYAVAVNSCTMALLLAVAWHLQPRNIKRWCDGRNQRHVARPGRFGNEVDIHRDVQIPKRTYVSVPQSIIHAGGWPTFRDEAWIGAYQLWPLPVLDSARWLTAGMYEWIAEKVIGHQAGRAILGRGMVCVSFHAAKSLGDTQGGAILLDDYDADQWLRRARFDGRTEGIPPSMDTFTQIGWHCYLSPDVATRLLWHLSVLPKHNEPLSNDDYPDLSQMEIFR